MRGVRWSAGGGDTGRVMCAVSLEGMGRDL